MKAIRCYLIDNDLTELCESQSKNWFVRYWCTTDMLMVGLNGNQWDNFKILKNICVFGRI